MVWKCIGLHHSTIHPSSFALLRILRRSICATTQRGRLGRQVLSWDCGVLVARTLRAGRRRLGLLGEAGSLHCLYPRNFHTFRLSPGPSSALRVWLCDICSLCNLMSPTTVISSPGKVLAAGGYLVLDPAYSGVVISTSSRFYAVIQDLGRANELQVRSPQFIDAVWNYKVEVEGERITVDPIPGK